MYYKNGSTYKTFIPFIHQTNNKADANGYLDCLRYAIPVINKDGSRQFAINNRTADWTDIKDSGFMLHFTPFSVYTIVLDISSGFTDSLSRAIAMTWGDDAVTSWDGRYTTTPVYGMTQSEGIMYMKSYNLHSNYATLPTLNHRVAETYLLNFKSQYHLLELYADFTSYINGIYKYVTEVLGYPTVGTGAAKLGLYTALTAYTVGPNKLPFSDTRVSTFNGLLAETTASDGGLIKTGVHNFGCAVGNSINNPGKMGCKCPEGRDLQGNIMYMFTPVVDHRVYTRMLYASTARIKTEYAFSWYVDCDSMPEIRRLQRLIVTIYAGYTMPRNA